jgi:hypothetical protein
MLSKESKAKFKEFKKELNALLKKYDADINYHMEGDTYGIVNDFLGVQFLEPLKEGDNFRKWSDLEPLD